MIFNARSTTSWSLTTFGSWAKPDSDRRLRETQRRLLINKGCFASQRPTLADKFNTQARNSVRHNLARSNGPENDNAVGNARDPHDASSFYFEARWDAGSETADCFSDCVLTLLRVSRLIKCFKQDFQRNRQTSLPTLLRRWTAPDTPHDAVSKLDRQRFVKGCRIFFVTGRWPLANESN